MKCDYQAWLGNLPTYRVKTDHSLIGEKTKMENPYSKMLQQIDAAMQKVLRKKKGRITKRHKDKV